MFLLGLTGSIGMGKSTTAQMFADEGCAIWDADGAVHRLYAKGGAGVTRIAEIFPNAVVDGEVSTAVLKEIISKDDTALKRIEKIIHPLVGQDRAAFLADTKAKIIVIDVPLLFETGGEKKVDAVACVYVDDATQEQRVMDRGTMTLEQLELIRGKQLPAAEKCNRADYVIHTDTLENARRQVQIVLADIKGKMADA